MSLHVRLRCLCGAVVLEFRLTVCRRLHGETLLGRSSGLVGVDVECRSLVLDACVGYIAIEDGCWRSDIAAVAAFGAERFFMRLYLTGSVISQDWKSDPEDLNLIFRWWGIYSWRSLATAFALLVIVAL